MLDTEPVVFPTTRTHLFDAPELALCREQQSLCRLRFPDGKLGWLVSDYSLAKAVLMGSHFGATEIVGADPIGDPAKGSAIRAAIEGTGFPSFLGQDPPDHTKLKRLVATHFSVRPVEEMRGEVERIVSARLGAMEKAGPPADLVRTFAAPLSLATQCALLGIPAEKMEPFYRLGTESYDEKLSVPEVVEAWQSCGDYLRSLVEQRRSDPVGDVVSEIAANAELSTQEAAGIVILLILAGLEATGDMLALGVFALLCHPDQLDALRADPALVEPAVEELLRYLSLFRLTTRIALADLELGGQRIVAGERVTVSLAAANRDPEKFDHPDRLELARGERDHLAFGKGIHMCLGQRLARLELQVGLGGLLERFPSLRLDVAAEEVPVYTADQISYGVRTLPVAW